MQVGLYSATYTANEATILLDDFQLIDYDENSAIKKISSSSPVNVYSVSNRVVVNNKSDELATSLKLFSIDGSMVYNAKALNAQRIEIPVANKGIYIMDVTVDNSRYTQKVVVK